MTRLARLSLRHPLATLAALAAATLALGLGVPRVGTEAGYRAFLGADHPAVRELDSFAERFGGGLPFAAVWSCRETTACRSVFDAASLAMAHDVARGLEATPGIRRVDGPATSPLLFPVLFELPRARRLAPDGAPAADVDALAKRAVVDPMWSGQLVSADGSAAALLVHLESSDGAAGERALARLRQLLAPHEASGFRFHLVGGPVEFVVAGGELESQARRIVPVMVGLVAVALIFLYRGWAGALASLACVGVAVAWTLGLQGWLGWPGNTLSQTLPALVLVMGVCDAMHLLAGYAARLPGPAQTDRAQREAALLGVAGEVGRPCLLTTLTTAAGFLSFAAGGLESFARFGWLAAFGVGAALLLSFTLLPLALVRLPAHTIGSRLATDRWTSVLDRSVAFASRRARGLLVASAVLAVLGSWGFSLLRVDASFEDLYGEESQVVEWARAAAVHLREPETLEISLTAPDGPALHAPEVLRVIAQAEELASLEGLSAPLSILVPMRELHSLVHGAPLSLSDDDEARERSRHMLRILGFEDRELVELFLAREARSFRLSFQSAKLPQRELRALLAQVDDRLAELLPEGWAARVTGPLAVVGTMIDEIRRTQLRSFALAAALVWALLTVFFRSPGFAALAVAPTLLAVLTTLGAMGLGGVPLDVGSAMVAAVLLGLAVDDAIHLLSAYRRRRAEGLPPERAIAAAVREVGRALATTSLALAFGFVALAFAPWHSIASFGFVSAVAIAGALVAHLLLLPACLVTGARLRARW